MKLTNNLNGCTIKIGNEVVEPTKTSISYSLPQEITIAPTPPNNLPPIGARESIPDQVDIIIPKKNDSWTIIPISDCTEFFLKIAAKIKLTGQDKSKKNGAAESEVTVTIGEP
ncbi:MAG: hypothetical protein NT166_02245 [Candidatus Aminicenantes bacterium]|nr:hypothetical protein [Candidatus Aminicenantes bacterium]